MKRSIQSRHCCGVASPVIATCLAKVQRFGSASKIGWSSPQSTVVMAVETTSGKLRIGMPASRMPG